MPMKRFNWFWWCEDKNVADIFVSWVKSRQSLCQSWEVRQMFNPNIIQSATQYSQYLDVQTKYNSIHAKFGWLEYSWTCHIQLNPWTRSIRLWWNFPCCHAQTPCHAQTTKCNLDVIGFQWQFYLKNCLLDISHIFLWSKRKVEAINKEEIVFYRLF